MSSRRTTKLLDRSRALSIGLVGLGCVLAIAACGSPSKPGGSASNSGRFIAYSQCMRTHGVPNFPDPSAQGGIHISSRSGIDPFTPAFKAAQSACSKLLPGGGPGAHGAPSAQDRRQMVAISECMRTHGVPGFPDPTTAPPSSPSGYSEVIGHNGLFIAVPDTINAGSPAFKHAAATCKFGTR